ncbi:MAG: alpha/beta fold hydrolase [Bacteroidia bacterium]|nr:alpha/beta fold hydrolase [Bacteroidia bacterium]
MVQNTVATGTLETLRHLGRLQQGLVDLVAAPAVAVGTQPRHEVFASGLARLYHYPAVGPSKNRNPLLVVYALVNRTGMLDLQPDRSFLRRLAQAGLDVYLIDWQPPTRYEQHRTTADYVLGDLRACVRYLQHAQGVAQVHLAGVCQGGVFASIYAARFPREVKTLTTLVTPIDYASDEGLLFAWARALDADKIAATYGLVPPSFLMAGFERLRPFAKVAKYIDVLAWSADTERLLNFVRLEQWLYQCPPIPGPAFAETVRWLFQENRLLKGTYTLEGHPIRLGAITCPVLNVFATEDHIVPPASARALLAEVGSADTTELQFPGGHIGVFVSRRTQEYLAPAVADWVLARDA